MSVDHYGKPLASGNTIEILPTKLFKVGLGWYRRIGKMRKHCRQGKILSIMASGDLRIQGVDLVIRQIPTRFVKFIHA